MRTWNPRSETGRRYYRSIAAASARCNVTASHSSPARYTSEPVRPCHYVVGPWWRPTTDHCSPQSRRQTSQSLCWDIQRARDTAWAPAPSRTCLDSAADRQLSARSCSSEWFCARSRSRSGRWSSRQWPPSRLVSWGSLPRRSTARRSAVSPSPGSRCTDTTRSYGTWVAGAASLAPPTIASPQRPSGTAWSRKRGSWRRRTCVSCPSRRRRPSSDSAAPCAPSCLQCRQTCSATVWTRARPSSKWLSSPSPHTSTRGTPAPGSRRPRLADPRRTRRSPWSSPCRRRWRSRPVSDWRTARLYRRHAAARGQVTWATCTCQSHAHTHTHAQPRVPANHTTYHVVAAAANLQLANPNPNPNPECTCQSHAHTHTLAALLLSRPTTSWPLARPDGCHSTHWMSSTNWSHHSFVTSTD